MIKDLIIGKSITEKSDIKTKEHCKVQIKSFQYAGFDIEILEIGQERNLLKVIAKAKKDGVNIFVDNPLYYQNPPILVKDGTQSQKLILGELKMVDNYKEDINEAFKQMIGDTIKSQWRH